MSVLDLQRFAIESAMQSGKSFRIEADGTLVFDVEGKPTKVTKVTKTKQSLITPTHKEVTIGRRIHTPTKAVNGKERTTVGCILKAAAVVGRAIKIRAPYNSIWAAQKSLGFEGHINEVKDGVYRYTRKA